MSTLAVGDPTRDPGNAAARSRRNFAASESVRLRTRSSPRPVSDAVRYASRSSSAVYCVPSIVMRWTASTPVASSSVGDENASTYSASTHRPDASGAAWTGPAAARVRSSRAGAAERRANLIPGLRLDGAG